MADTDRELLELAAKAAGIEVWFPRMNGGKGPDGTRIILTPCHTHGADGSIVEWNPITDDGDALRLAVMLRLDIHVDGNLTEVHGPFDGFFTEAHLGDPCAATRRAIVRTAAEIGRAM